MGQRRRRFSNCCLRAGWSSWVRIVRMKRQNPIASKGCRRVEIDARSSLSSLVACRRRQYRYYRCISIGCIGFSEIPCFPHDENLELFKFFACGRPFLGENAGMRAWFGGGRGGRGGCSGQQNFRVAGFTNFYNFATIKVANKSPLPITLPHTSFVSLKNIS